jgi:hypothetical protein
VSIASLLILSAPWGRRSTAILEEGYIDMSKLLGPAIIASAALAAAALAPAAVSAAGLKPGSYSLGGIQDICLQAGGTWYGEDFAAWGGDYLLGSNGETVIFGNYNSGAGNDSIIVKKTSGTWNEWADDLSYTFYEAVTVSKNSKTCTPPPVSNKKQQNNPSE